ncbi:hypothetical protein ZHAS_00006452 [Anopheles sinensis]|uniref:CCHC-type domain-containing protein n=1 Tax=Anopheles sinensis TaxID=74873 RepID=A0A084VMC9_ANOSI|nr:hypothetical protein ZHAS_00006452 [Anopheles sinensis]
MVPHRGGVSTATPLPHGTSFRTAQAYATTIQPQATADGVNYIYHPAAVVAATASAGTNVPSNSTISFLPAQPPPLPPSSTVASTQTASLPSVRSSPSPAAATHVGLLQQSKGGGSAGMYGGGSATLPYTSVAPSCYNCGSLKHTGLECPEASMEDMTRTTNFTLDYNTTSTVTPVTTPTTTSAPAIGGNNNTATLDTNINSFLVDEQYARAGAGCCDRCEWRGGPSSAGSNITNSTNNLVSASVASAVAAASVAAATAAVYRSFFRSLFSLSSSTNQQYH